MELLAQAVRNHMGTAQSTANTNNATYRAAIYTFNIGFLAALWRHFERRRRMAN
jgi:hypothetical protein